MQEAHRLTAALGEFDYDGTGLACVAGIDAAEAVRRLEAAPVVDGDRLEVLHEPLGDPYAYDMDKSLHIVGVTSVPGGCVVTQPWGYAPQMTGVLTRLSAGTLRYGLYANPKSGQQGSIARNGSIETSDLHSGGEPDEDDTPAQVLAAYLYQHSAIAYACAFTGLRPADRRAVTGPPDVWAELPRRDYWSH
ncbi:ankyrin repeat domain-containing protein [Streptomyces brasiliscabiei]|uniref:ankyrin repeat domain-containing protein n=1 Tax=Streptomyces brasiliscabiei TaxID=2736302 RepID=UPI0027DFED3F|nr:ankyrin repeat domain-containing protein [Streptomyces brasiliscabiei]